MIEFLGNKYFIDFKALNKFLMTDMPTQEKTYTETETETTYDADGNVLNTLVITRVKDKPKEINVIRYDIIRGFIDDLGGIDGNEGDEEDYQLGVNNLDKMSVRFKLAYNTLYYYDIIKTV